MWRLNKRMKDNNYPEVITREEFINFKENLITMVTDIVKDTVHSEIDQNNSILMSKITDMVVLPAMTKIEELGKLVTYQDVNKKWVSKSVKSYLNIRTIKESKYEYNAIIEAYKAKIRSITGKCITRLEDIPQTVENLKLLDEVCKFMYPINSTRGKFKF